MNAVTRDEPVRVQHSDRVGIHRAEAFGALVQGIGVVAGLIHVAFCILFFWAGVDMLGYVNIGSVLCYVCVFVWARQGKIWRAWATTVLEVLGHAILAVAVIGWESGFHYYILLVIPVSVISSVRPVGLKALSVVFTMLTYLTLDIVMRHRLPPYVLQERVIDGLHYFNVLGVMFILLFLAGYYYRLIVTAEAKLRVMASTDPLTQLHNRRAIDEVIRREFIRSGRGGHPLSFMVCDLDHFKVVNDTHGHEAGDVVLRAVAHTLAQGVRGCDYVARWGGEEFLVVLPDADREQARCVAERLRAAVEALPIEVAGGALKITVTIGVATMHKGESSDEAIGRADAALYAGKHAGRNRIHLAL